VESFTRTLAIDDRSFEVHFRRRPFREGFEVQVDLGSRIVRCGELGLGEHAALEWMRGALARELAKDTCNE
jgi:hypothetical protein